MLFEYEGLVLKKNRLFNREWDKNIKNYKETDVSRYLPSFLCANIIIEEGTTLRDFFKLLDDHKAILGIIQKRNYFLEYLDYSLNTNYINNDVKSNDPNYIETDYVEIYFTLDHTVPEKLEKDIEYEIGIEGSDKTEKQKVYSAGDDVPEETYFTIGFHGFSKPATEEMLKNNNMDPNKFVPGEYRFPLMYFGCDVAEFLDVPLKISNRIVVNDRKFSNENLHNISYLNRYNNITLIQLIDTIFHQLSVFGNPEESMKMKEELQSK